MPSTLDPSPTLAELGLMDATPGRLLTAELMSFSTDVALLRPLHQLPGGPAELVLPRSEFYPDLAWAIGEHYVVEQVDAQPRALVSVVRPSMLALLAETLSPETRAGSTRVMVVARQPGVRAKVAVAATVAGLDPVATVVGRAAARVRAMGVALRGERVDVVLYDEDPLVFLAHAFAPASVSAVRLVAPRVVEVIVPAHQIASAVGAGGLNTTLAGRLCGYRVTVVPEP